MPVDNQTALTLAAGKRSIPTADVMAAAMSRLNRTSVTALLGQLSEAINTCCEGEKDEAALRVLVQNEIKSFQYGESLTSLVNLINAQIDDYDYSTTTNPTTNTWVDARIANYVSTNVTPGINAALVNYDYSQSATFKAAVDARISNYNYSTIVDGRIANYNYSTIVDARVANYDFRNTTNVTFNQAVDSRITSFNLSPVIDARITAYNYAPIIDARFATYDFRNTTNTSFSQSIDARITAYNYAPVIDARVASYDFRNTTNTTFNQSIDARVANYDFRTTPNNSFNQTIDARVASYDFRNTTNTSFNQSIDARIGEYNWSQIFDQSLKNYDFRNFSNPSFNTFVDSRIANYNFASNVALTNHINSTITDRGFVTQQSLYQTMNEWFTSPIYQDFRLNLSSFVKLHAIEANFRANSSILQLIGDKAMDIRGWVSNEVVPPLVARIFDLEQRDFSGLKTTVDGHTTAISNINKTIGNISNLTTIKNEIDALQLQINNAITLAGSLDDAELGQVRAVILQLMSEQQHANTIISNVRINVNNTSLSLVDVLNVLMTADLIDSVSIDYHDESNPALIRGCTYKLVDNSSVTFKCRRYDEPNGDLTFEFYTESWKNSGVPAKFSSKFARRRSTSYKICKRDVSLDWYEPLESTNLLFSLFS